MEYRILSPDGFEIECQDTYHGVTEATEALLRFRDRYKGQGYYSTGNWERIPIDEIISRCQVIET